MDLDHQGLTRLPELPAGLEYLSAYDNELTELPDELWGPDRLAVLNLPAELGDLPNLTEYLYLSDNRA
ncbi:hypothetical protein [Amycolatopsis methanolica]|uniref:hypothetical protein n=1 Tax=Amycolatopsis methanolica TaxID=1814 RepID=UPI003431FB81